MRAFLSLLLTAAFAAGSRKAGPPSIDPNIEKVVRAYVSDQKEEEGDFQIEDDLLGRTWDANIMLVHTETLRRLADGRVILCVDFKGGDAKNKRVPVKPGKTVKKSPAAPGTPEPPLE